MQTIPLAKICPIKTNFEQLISDEPPHSYIRTPYFGIGIMRNLQMAMQLCISILFIDKWLCNFTFRFCSSTKWLCNFAFRFCSSTKWLSNFAIQLCRRACIISTWKTVMSENKMEFPHGKWTMSMNKMEFPHGKWTMSMDKMEFPHGKWAMSMNKMEFPHGKWAMSMNKFEFPHGNALCRFCVLPLSIAIAIFLSIPHKYYLCTREIFMIDVKKQSIFP